ncbi:hypothetical protein ACFYUD_21160 [Nocardia tengchongensis]
MRTRKSPAFTAIAGLAFSLTLSLSPEAIGTATADPANSTESHS